MEFINPPVSLDDCIDGKCGLLSMHPGARLKAQKMPSGTPVNPPSGPNPYQTVGTSSSGVHVIPPPVSTPPSGSSAFVMDGPPPTTPSSSEGKKKKTR